MKYLLPMVLAFAALSACQDETPPEPASAASLTPIPKVDAGAVVAAKCVECHGADGASGKPGVPFLAGQQEQFLAGALHTYANGTRKHEGMKAIAQALSEHDVVDIAAYYAQLSTVWKGAAPPPAPKVRSFDKSTVAVGQSSSRHCDSCHGADGNSTRAGVPSLAGLQPEYFTKASNAYFQGERSDPIMSVFKESLDKHEIKTMAAYYASQQRGKTRFVSKGNSDAGKAKAVACVGCHGADGNSINPAMPSLAGQNGPYLEKVLLAYHSGQRKDGMMQAAMANLQPKDLRDLAAYFASQEPHAPSARVAAASDKFDPVGDGARLALNCAGCHGDKGNSTMPGVPSLSRLHSDYLTTAIKAYRDGGRNNAIMKNFVVNLSDADIVKLALYYATQEPSGKPPHIKGDAAAGEKLAATCTGCHGDKGNSTAATTPTIAGQDPVYLAAAVNNYASGARAHADMQKAAKEMQASDLHNVVAYFATQAPVKPGVRLPEAPDALAERCDRCHGKNGRSNEPIKPRLNGQVEVYLAQALRSYKNGARDNTMMHAMSDVLSDLEIDALAAYYARK